MGFRTAWRADRERPRADHRARPSRGAHKRLEWPAISSVENTMSRNSKAKRDKRKKQQPKRPIVRLGQAPQVTNHAVLQDADGRVVAAIGLQGGSEWMLSIGGQTMGSADNPVPMLAMLKHLANLQEKEGKTISLEYSTQLQQMIDDLAAEEGKTAEEYLTTLVSEFENADGDDAGEGEGEGEEGEDDSDSDSDAVAADADDAADAADADADATDADADDSAAETAQDDADATDGAKKKKSKKA
ncbi:hypothetical protein VDR72_10055 [Xanthomonas campestris pv. campestris]|uniref:hypothetical protein n=1 Tax=Xanthomonas campestris TaxID=339 RepID=UPI001F194A9A|nr:hypothetical protein [Xanthomonas campestris]MEB1181140.1 hypothetical protein [Xanthomonas campestris pv. campestris]MEB1653160.1 hypothetical protein [Xanthomonas campestris pv. campestris]MEB1862219.1 hypothetical protein [Xanthomonas campestris pv. campestris]MEB1905150.1 hypothetical protein [Xanthomonas campestris pv. campestris]MEB1936570.1 hypothetical protein [Xanthomonas campestris pv. campestris]